MNRAEREAYDAALEWGEHEPCPVCGSRDLAGVGPCSDACARLLDMQERRTDEDAKADAERRAEKGREWERDAALERLEEMEPEWMGLAE